MQAISRGLFTALQKHMDVYHWILRVEHYVGLGMSGFKLVGHWLHVPILCLMAAFAVYVVAYHLWCWRERGRLLGATQYASTSHGLVEYKWYGSGPVVLVLHGTPGGSDQGGMWHQLLLGGEHFSVLAPSRFGYVGTQLEAGHHGSRAELTLPQQAEAINGLLHALDLNKVGVVGIGGGGPLAMELVKNYPHKFWAFVLLGAVTRKWQPPEEESFARDLDSLERFVFRQLNGLAMWTYYLLSVFFPSFMLRSLYAEGSSLDPNAIEKHTRAVLEKVAQRLALQRAARSCLPPSLRSQGMDRDLQLFASLPESIDDMNRAESVPALIVHGKADKSVLAANHAEAAHAAMPWSELYLVDEASGMLWLGQEGEAVSRKVVSFLMGRMERGQVDELRHHHPANASPNSSVVVGVGGNTRRKANLKNHLG